jgi:hypothetical protein
MHSFAREWIAAVSTDKTLSVEERAGLCLFAQFVGDGGVVAATTAEIESTGYGPASIISRNVALAGQTRYIRNGQAVLP